MFRFVDTKTGKVWIESAPTFAEARKKILKALSYKDNTAVIKGKCNTYLIKR